MSNFNTFSAQQGICGLKKQLLEINQKHALRHFKFSWDHRTLFGHSLFLSFHWSDISNNNILIGSSSIHNKYHEKKVKISHFIVFSHCACATTSEVNKIGQINFTIQFLNIELSKISPYIAKNWKITGNARLGI